MKKNIIAKITTLETSKNSIFIIDNNVMSKENKPLYKEDSQPFKPFHIYITTGEPIKPYDWCLLFDSFGNSFLNGDGPSQYIPDNGNVLNDGLRKVIATTDDTIDLPNIVDIFRQFYFTQFNNDNKINKVSVTHIIQEDGSMIPELIMGEIVPTPVKTKWNYDELSDIVYNAMKSRVYTPIIEFNEWMQVNIY